MAERQFIIRIENTTEGKAGEKVGGAGGISKKTKTETKESGNKSSGIGESIVKSARIPLTGMAVYASARKITNTIVSHNNSLIEVRTGSREQQERTSFVYNTAMGFLDSTVSGAAAGALVGGPVGALVGGLLGFVKQGMSMEINVAKTRSMLSAHRQLEDISRDLQSQRITVSGSRYMNVTQM